MDNISVNEETESNVANYLNTPITPNNQDMFNNNEMGLNSELNNDYNEDSDENDDDNSSDFDNENSFNQLFEDNPRNWKISCKKFFKSFFSFSSLLGGITNMIILSLGNNCFFMSIYVKNISLSLAIIVLIIIGVFIWFLLYLLAFLCSRENIYIYTKMIQLKYNKYYAYSYDVIIVLYIGIILVMIQSNIYQSIIKIINDYSSSDNWMNEGIRLGFLCGIGFFLLFPLCLLKQISKMRFTSAIGILTFISIIIILTLELPSLLDNYWEKEYKISEPSTHLNLWNMKESFTDNAIWNYCSLIFGSFMMTLISIVPIFKLFVKSRKNSTLYRNVNHKDSEFVNMIYSRFLKTISITIVIDLIIHITFLVIGYLMSPITQVENILDIEKSNNILKQILSMITIIMKFPISYHSLRLSIVNWLNMTITTFKNFYLSLFTIIIITILSFICNFKDNEYNQLRTYSLLFSICFIVMTPALLYFKTNKEIHQNSQVNNQANTGPNIRTKVLFLVISAIMTIIALIAIILSIIN